MRLLNIATLVLLIVGGLNWGLVGVADLNLVDTIFGAGSVPARIIYVVVALAALYQLLPLFRSVAEPPPRVRRY
jgi:uncharacterized membrane protein YuzA (DUF378 family)